RRGDAVRFEDLVAPRGCDRAASWAAVFRASARGGLLDGRGGPVERGPLDAVDDEPLHRERLELEARLLVQLIAEGVQVLMRPLDLEVVRHAGFRVIEHVAR